MSIRNATFAVGLAAIAFAAFLYLVGIPYGVTAPTNIRNIVLSPVFWPQVLAGLLALAGLGLVLAARREGRAARDGEPGGASEGITAPDATPPGAWLRTGLMAALMVAYVLLIPVLGMVWASVLAFAGLAFLIRTHHPVAALVAAVIVPLVLYAFFAHVAGVAVPQGEFVRLP